MEPQIVFDHWYELADGSESFWCDEPLAGHEVVGECDGWGARLSAPGYADCTEWAVHETEEEAREYLADAYDLCPKCLAEECDCDSAVAQLGEAVDVTR
jgi:hypothetical protein